MALVRLLRGGQVTLPAETRRGARAQRGRLPRGRGARGRARAQAGGGLVDRKTAWKRLLEIVDEESGSAPSRAQARRSRAADPGDRGENSASAMLRVVLDSSVLISAFHTPRGTCAELLRAGGRGAFVPCLSPEPLADMAAPLLRDQSSDERSPATTRPRWRPSVATSATWPSGSPTSELSGAVPLDPKDDVIRGHRGGKAQADYLVAGDLAGTCCCSGRTRGSGLSRRASCWNSSSATSSPPSPARPPSENARSPA